MTTLTPTNRTQRRVGVGLPIFSPEGLRLHQWRVEQHCLRGRAFERITILEALIGPLWHRVASRNRRVLVLLDEFGQRR